MPIAPGGPEMIMVPVIVLVAFGAGKLPGALKDLGRSVKESRKAQAEDGAEDAQARTQQGTSIPPSTL